MKTGLDCFPCFVRQTLDVLRRITSDQAVHEQVLRSVLKACSEIDLRQSPPAMGQYIHRLIRQVTGNPDPYRQAKEDATRRALEMLPGLQEKVAASSDPFSTALRLAAAGNIIDLGVKGHVEDKDIAESIASSLRTKIDPDLLEFFKARVSSSKSILYIGDNAGEIVLDRLLLEQLNPDKVVFAVRGQPTINDATIDDARQSGITDLVQVIDSGSDAPGTILEDCSEEFCQYFQQADLIIAKGQGNYETLSASEAPIFFLLKVKCPVIAANIKLPLGDIVLKPGLSLTAAGQHFVSS
jgi:damage-control phosphatase, subfamily I